MKKLSPTVGVYFYADDYIKFISDLHGYLSMPIEMISASESKYKEELFAKGQQDIPVGRLGDVEIIFLHYKDATIAKDKWTRRVERINWDNLIIKFSYMNNATDEHIHQFAKISEYKTFAFVTKPFPYQNTIVIKGEANGQIANDTIDFNKYINIYKLINGTSENYL